MRKKIGILITAIIAMTTLGFGLAFATSAHASTSGYPNPTPSVTATVTPTPPPVVNPFANCRFSTTFANTYSVVLHRWIPRAIPAIVCVSRFGGVQVYDLTR